MVGIFLPMIPEVVVAAMAVAKLGAIFLPLFSGYGADAVAVRLVDAGAKALVTADGFLRRGAADRHARRGPGGGRRGRHPRDDGGGAPAGPPARRRDVPS